MMVCETFEAKNFFFFLFLNYEVLREVESRIFGEIN